MTAGPELRGRHGPALLAILLFGTCLVAAPQGSLAQLPISTPFLPPGAAHPLGTDDLGRDMLQAVLQAGRTTLLVAGPATALALGLGILAGMAAALGGRVADEVVMRLADIAAGLPTLLVAILTVALFGGSTLAVALVIGLTRWPMVGRLVRVEVMALRQAEFIRAAEALGLSRLAIARRHMLPNVAAQAATATGILFGGAMVAEAALAFVGLGDPEATSWGQLLASGFSFADRAWWVWVVPAAGMVTASALVAMAAQEQQGR
ncbi:ABC transporter permease [Phreatobacter sp.]|uniref:ABC transporter permease n=1 Tax=Phreatobacter sp. TaxID=1966341 RepID=UPI003F71A529